MSDKPARPRRQVKPTRQQYCDEDVLSYYRGLVDDYGRHIAVRSLVHLLETMLLVLK